MLYQLLKIPARIGFHLYTRNLKVNDPKWFEARGPLLLACNHPNSFLDAIVLCTLFKKPVYSLARGDAFKNKWVAKFLRAIYILPVYRTSEGVENLEHNYSTFEACKTIFKKNGIVLIFSEGLCINEWHLRPLKKGTARLAGSSWEDGIPLTVLPIGINYDSFKKAGKNIEINFGKPIIKTAIEPGESHGKTLQSFNALLQKELEKLVLEFNSNDQVSIKDHFEVPVPALKRSLLFLPAASGYIFHWPVYTPVNAFVQKRFSRTGHYDSVVLGLLFFAYPLYLLIVTAVLFLAFKSSWALCALLVLPFCAWAYIQLKK
ncbi:MAG: 1-acyl-sn-glycerol-3-phosphate acyltransferase [Ferruginibacter sp.]